MAYGDFNQYSLVKRLGVEGEQQVHTVSFTTASTGAPTVDTAKTKGPLTVARTGVGVFTITLPYVCKSIMPTYSRAGTSAQEVLITTPTTTTVVVTVVTAGGSTPAETTGLVVNLVIWTQVGP